MRMKHVFTIVSEVITDLFLAEEEIDGNMLLGDFVTDDEDAELLAEALEEEFGVIISPSDMEELSTVDDLVEYIWEEV